VEGGERRVESKELVFLTLHPSLAAFNILVNDNFVAYK